MKKIAYILMALLSTVSCVMLEKDNYDGPDIFLKGKVTYNGQPLNLRNGEANFRLYEEGWELSADTYLTVPFAQDGSFSAAIFKGKTYRIERQANIGPWVNPTEADVIRLENFDGKKEIEIPVTPYYILENANITCSNKKVCGSVSVKEVAGGLAVEHVGLYVSRNVICDNVYSGLGKTENKNVKAGDTVNLEVDLSNLSVNSTQNSLPSTGVVYARLGLKVAGVGAMIYTEAFKLQYK